MQEGAVLRCEYTDFFDRNTEYDTLNTIYAHSSAIKEKTLSLDITNSFAKELLNQKDISIVDEMFSLLLLSQKSPINKDVLVSYLKRRYIELGDTSNIEVYKGLGRILKENQGSLDVTITKKNNKRMILID